jgi:transposase
VYLRRCYRAKDGKRHAYWALVKSVRTERGPRQQVVAYLGEMDEGGRLGIKEAAEGRGSSRQDRLFDEPIPRWVEVDTRRVRVERGRAFGGPWLGLQLIRKLGLDQVLEGLIPAGREEVPWPVMAWILVLCRLCEPSSELHIAEHFYERSALEDLLGVTAQQVNDDRLYRALDKLLPHKAELEKHLKRRLGELFELKYDLLLYDVTSTYFEGQAEGNPLAQRGYSRDGKPQCKQVCIALVVSREGMPVGYELFAGNRSDVTTMQEIVTTMEGRYGRADRIWVMDRGMVSQENVGFLLEGDRRYIVGTPRGMLKRYERELLAQDWTAIRQGLEVKLCPGPDGKAEGKASAEVFILCRSAERREKEKAIHERFEKRIEEGLTRLAAGCQRRPCEPTALAQRVGRLLGQNTRAAGLFKTDVTADASGRAALKWSKVESWRNWSSLSEGCYLLRSNVTDWSGEDLWRAYMQLTEAEKAFRIHKSDLTLRPIWHQKQERVEAHILVCFLAYVLWKTLSRMCHAAGLGDEPRKVLMELSRIQSMDVVLPTREGVEIRRRCVMSPSEHQAILLERLRLRLPNRLELVDV